MELTNQFIILLLLGVILGILLMARVLSGWMRPGYGYGDPRIYATGYRAGYGFVDTLLLIIFIALLGFAFLGGRDWKKLWRDSEQIPDVQSKVMLSQSGAAIQSPDTTETIHYVEDFSGVQVPHEEIYLQIGAFQSYHQAQMLVLETRNKISDHLLSIEHQDYLYKVRIGPFTSAQEARDMKAEYSFPGFLVRY